VTAAGRRGPHLYWRPLPGTLIGRRGAALAPPIVLAVGLNAAAVTGLAGIAGFHAVYAALAGIRWPWLCAVPAALGVSAAGYYLAYRGIYAAEGGYQLSRGQLTAVAAAGFGGLFDTGGFRPDGPVLQASGASRRQALVRVTTLTGMEQAMLALYGCAASIAWLCLGRPGVPADFTLPWAVIPIPAFAAAFWLASRSRARLAGRAGWRAQLAVLLDAVLLIRALFARPVRHRGAIAGMALFWAGDALAVWSALAAFGPGLDLSNPPPLKIVSHSSVVVIACWCCDEQTSGARRVAMRAGLRSSVGETRRRNLMARAGRDVRVRA